MLDISKFLFLGDQDDLKKAEEEYGIDTLSGDNFILIPFADPYYSIMSNFAAGSGGYNHQNYKSLFGGSTTIWITQKFFNISKVSSYHLFSKEDVAKLKRYFNLLDLAEHSNNVTINFCDYTDVNVFHEIMGKRLRVKKCISDSINDGCACRVCGNWSPMAVSDGLPDGKMNCWSCSTYRLHLCRKAVAFIKR